jgi:hypothetical protein
MDSTTTWWSISKKCFVYSKNDEEVDDKGDLEEPEMPLTQNGLVKPLGVKHC